MDHITGTASEEELLRSVLTLQRESDRLLAATRHRVRYEEMLAELAAKTASGKEEDARAVREELQEYRTVPPEITDEELTAHHTRKVELLRILAERGVPDTAAWLTEAEQHLATLTAANVEIISFGYLHGSPPDAHVLIDLREHFRDPHIRAELRELTGEDEPVYSTVLGTPGIPEVISAAQEMIRAFLAGPSAGQHTLRVALGCAGGRHRSAAAAMNLRVRLREIPTARGRLVHRDIGEPVVRR